MGPSGQADKTAAARIGGRKDRRPQGSAAAGIGGRRDRRPQGSAAAGIGGRRDRLIMVITAITYELIMAHERASELIMVITAMNSELIMTRKRASELIMVITAMNSELMTNFIHLITNYAIIYYFLLICISNLSENRLKLLF